MTVLAPTRTFEEAGEMARYSDEAQHALDTAAMTIAAQAATVAGEAQVRLDRHEAACEKRWQSLQTEMRKWLFGVITLLLGIIAYLIKFGLPWQAH